MGAEAVTVLFTDLVDSTALSSSLSRDAADALRTTHFTLLRGAIESTGGREVKNLGDGLMVVFASPSRAVACAIAMQQAIDRHNRRTDPPLSVRIGISTGEVAADDGDYFGDPVVEAARLCATSAGGQILAAELVAMLIGRRTAHDFQPVGALELKGLPHPVPTVEVRWSADIDDGGGEAAGMPLPRALARVDGGEIFGFFGRSHELASIADAIKHATADGHPRAVLVAGEPGVGKTALVAHAARHAHDTGGVTVAFGACKEDVSRPYHPWIEICTYLLDHAGDDMVSVLSPLHRGALARLVPLHAARLGTSDLLIDPESERVLLMDAVVALLEVVATRTPLVVVVDDVQWADNATLQTLRHLLTTAVAMATTAIVTYRDSDLSRTHPLTALLADLWRLPTVQRVAVAGLTGDDIVELITAAAGYDIGDEGNALAHALGAETAGNPFFITELLRHLGESDAFVVDKQGRFTLRVGVDELALPTSVRDVVARRVARLGDDVARVLSAAAVLGRDFDLDVLTALTERDDDTVIDALERATNAALVAEVPGRLPRYRFVHALIQHTLYVDLGAARRQRWHERAAEALEARRADDAEIARHWLAAVRPTDAGRAIAAARRAGDAAMAASAPSDAAAWYAQVLELLDGTDAGARTGGNGAVRDPRERAELLLRLGDAQRLAGQPEHVAALAAAAEAAVTIGADDILIAAALCRTAGSATQFAPDRRRVDMLESALARVAGDDLATRARLLAACAEEADPRDVELRVRLARAAIETARESGDSAALCDVLLVAYDAWTTPDNQVERAAATRDGLASVDALGDPVRSIDMRFVATHAAMEAGDLASSERLCDEALEFFADAPLADLEARVEMIESWRSLLRGDFAAAEAHAVRARDANVRIGNSNAEDTYGSQLFAIRRQQGRTVELLETSLSSAANVETIPSYRAVVAVIMTSLGQYDEARAMLREEAAAGFRSTVRNTVWASGMANWAAVAAQLVERDAAARIYDALAPFHDRAIYVYAVVEGSIAGHLGPLATVLERYDDADAHFAEALTLHRSWNAPFLIATTALDWAHMLTARNVAGDGPRATALVDEAAELAGRYGYVPLASRATELRAHFD